MTDLSEERRAAEAERDEAAAALERAKRRLRVAEVALAISLAALLARWLLT